MPSPRCAAPAPRTSHLVTAHAYSHGGGTSSSVRSATPPLSVATRALFVSVRAYQAVRAGRPSSCRYWPTCSEYALEALRGHGAVRGLWLTSRRLLRCHPWARSSGFDPVPEAVR